MNTKVIFGSLVLVVMIFVGCSSTPVPYSYGEEEQDTAKVNFVYGNPGVRLIDFDGYELPKPERRTYWNPISFPAGKPISFTVHAKYQFSSNNPGLIDTLIFIIFGTRDVDRSVIFESPPLTPDMNYRLTFHKGGGLPGKNTLILTNTTTGRIVHEQPF